MGKSLHFLEFKNTGTSELENEADKFAANILIDPNNYKRFCDKDDFSKDSIKYFSNQIGITPGIVVGRLQHEKKISYNRFNDLKAKLIWKDRI